MTEALAQKIKAMRTERSLSKREFADLVGVHPAIISFIETGRRAPSVRVAVKLAEVLGIGSDELLRILNESKVERETA